MVSLGDIDDLSLQELRSALAGSLSEIEELKRMVALMAAEIARLKDLNQRPNIKPNKPSGMDQGTPGEPKRGGKGLRGRLGRGPKKAPRVAVEDEVLPARGPFWLSSLHTAIMSQRVNWVLDADIRSFFDSVDHEWLMRMLAHRIADPRNPPAYPDVVGGRHPRER